MSLRALTARQVVALLLPKREELGISRLSSLGPFVALDVHVVQAVRVALVRGQVSATTGKGWSLGQALCGALGEALERYCAANLQTLDRQDCGHLDIAPLAGWGHPDGFVPSEVCTARELLGGKPCLLPAIDVHFPYHGGDLARTPVRPHTSGLASGATWEEAALFGMFEVIERYSSSRFFKRFRSECTGALIDSSTIRHPQICDALDSLRYRGYELFIFRINGIIPVYYVAILDAANLGPKFMVAGVAAHIDEAEALQGALLEAMQGIVVAAQGAREDLSRIASSYKTQGLGRDNPFYRIQKILEELNPSYAFSDASVTMSYRNSGDALRYILERMSGAGMTTAYCCDLSRADWPLHVVKIIVPSMFDSHVNPSRRNYATAAA